MDEEDPFEDEVAPLLASDATRREFERLQAKSARAVCFKGLPWIVTLLVFQVVLIRAETGSGKTL